MRTVVDFRTYYEVVSDLVGIVHLQGGNMIGLQRSERRVEYVRMLDDFKMGPNLVRGFQPAGIGPRDITPGTSSDALGGTHVLGRQPRIPISVLLPAQGLRLARRRVRRFRFGVGLQGRNVVPGDRRNQRHRHHWRPARPLLLRQLRACNLPILPRPRVSVGASLIWDSPFGPLRFDFAYPILKQRYDRIQWFQFGGGTRF